MILGTVAAISWRAAGAGVPLDAGRADVVAGCGILGDVHADPLSPRQLLLAGRGAYDDFRLEANALRENLLVDFDTAHLASGTIVQVGDEVLLRMMFQCEACGQLDRIRPGLAQRIGTRRGMLARALKAGTVRLGDTVRTLGVQAPPWSDDWRERVMRVLDAVPPDSAIEYRDLARLAGVQSSYCRAFPRLVATLGEAYTRKAVPAKSPSMLARWRGQGLFDLNQEEGAPSPRHSAGAA